MYDRQYYEDLLTEYIQNMMRNSTSVMVGGNMSVSDSLFNCRDKQSLFCAKDFNKQVKALLTLKRSLTNSNFKDALLSLPHAVLKTIPPLSISINSKQIDLLLFPFLRSMLTEARPNVSNNFIDYKLKSEELVKHDYESDKVFVFIMDDLNRPNEADCQKILMRYIHLINSEIETRVDAKQILEFLNHLGTILGEIWSGNNKVTQSVIDSTYNKIDKLLMSSSWSLFKEVDFIKSMYESRHKSLSEIEFESAFLEAFEEIILHSAIIDSLTTKASPICSKYSIIQPITNISQKINLRASDKPVIKSVYFLLKDPLDPTGLPYLSRVLIVNVLHQIYSFPFSAKSIQTVNNRLSSLNVTIYKDKIIDKIKFNSNNNWNRSGNSQLFDIDSSTNAQIRTDFHEQIPYFSFWFEIYKDLSTFSNSAMNLSDTAIRYHRDILKAIEDYFNRVFLISIAHFVKNVLLNINKSSVDDIFQKTNALLFRMNCLPNMLNQNSSELNSAQQSIRALIFPKANNLMALIPNNTSGLSLKEINDKSVDIEHVLHDIFKSVKFDNFKYFYEILAGTIIFTATNDNDRFSKNTSDPLFDFIKDALNRISLIESYFADETLDNKAVASKFSRMLSDISKDNAIQTTFRPSSSVNDSYSRIMSARF